MQLLAISCLPLAIFMNSTSFLHFLNLTMVRKGLGSINVRWRALMMIHSHFLLFPSKRIPRWIWTVFARIPFSAAPNNNAPLSKSNNRIIIFIYSYYLNVLMCSGRERNVCWIYHCLLSGSTGVRYPVWDFCTLFSFHVLFIVTLVH